LLVGSSASVASPQQDRAEVAAIDVKYQDAVKRNDAETMAQILHEDFVLVLGTGKTYTRGDLLESARSRHNRLRASGRRSGYADSAAVG
jgi:hypothetical protein